MAAKKQDHEYGIGELDDGTVDVFDESEIPARVAQLRAREKAAMNKTKDEIAALEAEAKGADEPDVSDLDAYDDLMKG